MNQILGSGWDENMKAFLDSNLLGTFVVLPILGSGGSYSFGVVTLSRCTADKPIMVLARLSIYILGRVIWAGSKVQSRQKCYL